MELFRAGLGKLKLVPLLLLFFLLLSAKQGAAGGEGQVEKPIKCAEQAGVQKDGCLIAIIVELDLSVVPNIDKNDPQRVQTVSETIQAVQDAVLKSLEGQNTAYIRRYKMLPYLAFWTDGKGIMKILSVPQVKAIVPDRALEAGSTMSGQ